MDKTTERAGRDRQDDKVVLMYPDTHLKEQMRDFEVTFTAFSVVKAAFFH